jgi:hypothetical protein
MDIPIDIPNKINPKIQDYISKSIIYTFDTKDIYHDSCGNIIYKFPYSKDTYWTNFKYSCYNITNNIHELLDIEIILITSDGYEYSIKKNKQFKDNKWYDTEWPIPSINTNINRTGIYFKIKEPIDSFTTYNINISLLGFTDLFPKVTTYLLLSSFDTYQFIFSKFEENLENKYGTIYNVEHNDYIREIISTACGIRLINRY